MQDVVLASSCQDKSLLQAILKYFIRLCTGESSQLLFGEESLWRQMGTF